MKKWFFQAPFAGWLMIIFVLLLGDIVLYHYEKRQFSPQEMTARIQNDFSNRQEKLHQAVSTGALSLPLQTTTLTQLKSYFSVVIFRKGKAVFWNNAAIPEPDLLAQKADALTQGGLVHLNYGIFYARSYSLDSLGDYAVSLIPIAYEYKNQQKYFQSGFVAGNDIPSAIQIGNKGLTIQNTDSSAAFHLNFQQTPKDLYQIGFRVGLLTALLLLCCFLWVHLTCLEIGKKYGAIVGWIFLFLFAALFTFFRNEYGYPSGFVNASLFSPKILASGNFIQSLPDLLLYVLFETWLTFYLVKYVPVKELINAKKNKFNKTLCLTLVLLLGLDLFGEQAHNIFILIIDSKLPFVVNNLENLSVYTFLGIGLMCLITLTIVFIIAIIDELLKAMFLSPLMRYLTFIILCLVCIFIWHGNKLTAFNLALLALSFISLLLLNTFGLPIASFKQNETYTASPHTYIWFLILCSWVTVEIYYFNFSKERNLRKIYATRQIEQNDAALQFSFSALQGKLAKDALIRSFWKQPTPTGAQTVNRHIADNYLGNPFKKYSAQFFYFNKNRKPLIGKDTMGCRLLEKADRLNGSRFTSGLISLKRPLGKNMYWGMIPIKNQSREQILGYIGIDFSRNNKPQKRKKGILLLPLGNTTDEQYFNNYSYAIYRNKNLTAQGGNYSFPYRFTSEIQHKTYQFQESWYYSDLFYQSKSNEIIIVRYKRNVLTNIISVFTDVLFIWLLFSALFFLLRMLVYQRNRSGIWRSRFNLTIRAKINWTILVTVFLSLLVVGGITVSFLKSHYQDAKRQNLQNLLFYFGQNIVPYIENEQKSDTLLSAQTPNQNRSLVYLLNSLTEEQGININLYDAFGHLMATSQSILLEKGNLSTLMNPLALHALRDDSKATWQGTEHLGQLAYPSLYLPLRNNKDQVIAYLNLPFYASEQGLKTEMYSIFSTLINIYMLIFFIAGIAALLTSNSIMRSFYLLIEQFRRIRLEHNTLIRWPYRDELGLLVNEYNKMIVKVEKMASRMASSEREAGWRELALQIAHEIKNPLTPMKLNIQFLKKAVSEEHQDIGSLTTQISDTLIEQIENLNLIATEFAHFARMPKARPEAIDVNSHLQSLIDLYRTENIEFEFYSDLKQPRVWMDKSYFLRAFTNLIKNSIQAIGKQKGGYILISVSKQDDVSLYISVKDNGTGIKNADKERVFTPHFTTKSSGSGIGLAMTRNMIELSQGNIGFESAVGKGTVFYVILPEYRK